MQICVNGSFHPSSQPVIRVANRSYRYGDGLFETILLRKGEMPLFSLHMERLYEGIGLLGYHTAVKPADLQQQKTSHHIAGKALRKSIRAHQHACTGQARGHSRSRSFREFLSAGKRRFDAHHPDG